MNYTDPTGNETTSLASAMQTTQSATGTANNSGNGPSSQSNPNGPWPIIWTDVFATPGFYYYLGRTYALDDGSAYDYYIGS